MPTVNFDPSFTRQKTGTQVSNLLDAEVSGSWTLDVWGKTRRAVEQESAAAEVERRRPRQCDARRAVGAGARLCAAAAVRLARRSARRHRQAVQALARYRAEPIQRWDRREVRRHHRPGARTGGGGAADQRRRCAGSERARDRGADRPPARRSDDRARQARARRPARANPRSFRAARAPPRHRRGRADDAGAERGDRRRLRRLLSEPHAERRLRLFRRPVHQGDRRRQSGVVLRPVGRPDAVQRRPDRRASRGGAPDLRSERRHLPPDGADRLPAGRRPAGGDPARLASARDPDRGGQGGRAVGRILRSTNIAPARRTSPRW